MSALVLPRRHTSSRPVMPRASRARHASKIGLRRPSTKDVAGIRHPITPAALGQADRLELNPRRAQSLLPRAVDLRLHDGVVRVAHVLLSRCWWRLFKAPQKVIQSPWCALAFFGPLWVSGGTASRARARTGGKSNGFPTILAVEAIIQIRETFHVVIVDGRLLLHDGNAGA